MLGSPVPGPGPGLGPGMHPLRTENSSKPLQLWTKGLLAESSLHLQRITNEYLGKV